jgi:hypothetical protein
MNAIVILLAVAGFAALAARTLRALLRLLGRGVDEFLAAETVSVRANRGDLTGMDEAADEQSVARRQRLGALARFAAWMGLLVAPPMTPWPAQVYAVCCVLWLLPGSGLRPIL